MNRVATAPNGFQLFVGDIKAARDDVALTAAGITHVVNCCTADYPGQPADWAPFAAKRAYRFVFTDDDESLPAQQQALQDPSAQWVGVVEFLRVAQAQGANVLVHCRMGWNRSVSTAALFLAASGLAPSLDVAIAQIRAARPEVPHGYPRPRYVAWAAAFLNPPPPLLPLPPAAAGGGSPASAEVQALYRLSYDHRFGELRAALSAAPPQLRAEAAAFRSANAGWSMLHQAAHGGCGVTVEALLGHGFDARALDKKGRTPADVAMHYGAEQRLVEWLRSK